MEAKFEEAPRAAYPKIGRHKNQLVLFSCHGEGVVLVGNGCWPIGHHCDNWAMSLFEDVHGTVTITCP